MCRQLARSGNDHSLLTATQLQSIVEPCSCTVGRQLLHDHQRCRTTARSTSTAPTFCLHRAALSATYVDIWPPVSSNRLSVPSFVRAGSEAPPAATASPAGVPRRSPVARTRASQREPIVVFHVRSPRRADVADSPSRAARPSPIASWDTRRRLRAPLNVLRGTGRGQGVLRAHIGCRAESLDPHESSAAHHVLASRTPVVPAS